MNSQLVSDSWRDSYNVKQNLRYANDNGRYADDDIRYMNENERNASNDLGMRTVVGAGDARQERHGSYLNAIPDAGYDLEDDHRQTL